MIGRVLAAAVAGVVLAGCGGSDPTAAPTPAPQPTPAPSAPLPAPAPEPEPEAMPAPPPPPADPATLAVQLVAAEQALRSDGLSEPAAAAAGMQQQVAYRTLAANPAWRQEVLGAAPPELRDAVTSQTDAAEGLFRLARPQLRLPTWRIVEPPPAEELLGHYRAATAEFGIGWEYLAAIHLVETRMGRIRGTSTAGARGPMQFMPGTWEQYGEGDVEDPRDAIRAAARYLRASGAPGNMDRALFAYNRSEAYVQAISAYAAQLRADERVLRGYYHWQVYYRHVDGDRVLPVGYDGTTGG